MMAGFLAGNDNKNASSKRQPASSSELSSSLSSSSAASSVIMLPTSSRYGPFPGTAVVALLAAVLVAASLADLAAAAPAGAGQAGLPAGDQLSRISRPMDYEVFAGMGNDAQDMALSPGGAGSAAAEAAAAREDALLQYLKKLSAIAARYGGSQQMESNLFSSPLFYKNDKRGIDFGTRRGYSGNLAARYLMGMAFANSPNSPGRK